MTPHSIVERVRDYTIIELNAAAALHHLNAMGAEQRRTVEIILEKMLRAMTRARQRGTGHPATTDVSLFIGATLRAG